MLLSGKGNAGRGLQGPDHTVNTTRRRIWTVKGEREPHGKSCRLPLRDNEPRSTFSITNTRPRRVLERTRSQASRQGGAVFHVFFYVFFYMYFSICIFLYIFFYMFFFFAISVLSVFTILRYSSFFPLDAWLDRTENTASGFSYARYAIIVGIRWAQNSCIRVVSLECPVLS
jgi:hypothetical protein